MAKKKKTSKVEIAKKSGEREAKNELTHQHIRNAYLEIIRDPTRQGRVPSIQELATHTGLHRNTVSSHLKNFDLVQNLHKFAIMGEDVLMAMFKTAMNGNVTAMVKFLEIVNKIKTGTGSNAINESQEKDKDKEFFDMGDGNKIIF